jgi:DNA-directed RNA polymerase beta' subunit
MEMNMHMPQDDEASAELRHLAAVPRQIISPANNSPIIGIFQDSLLGLYRFTRENIQFDSRQAMNLLMTHTNVNKSLFGNQKKLISNFELFSQILPPLSTKFNNGIFDGDKDDKKTSNNVIEILNGKMLRGQLDKGVKKLIHSIFNDFGFNSSADFIDHLQGIVTEYMKTSAFSVGISDLIADEETNDKITQAITKKKQQVKDIIDQLQIGVFENNSGKSNEEEFETQVNNILNKAREEAGKIGRNSLDKNNRFVVMVNAGSKGSDINIAQMISCLGQQNVDGKRIGYGFEDRTLPHYNKFDDGPEARGFVENSFIQGLSPQELFFHAMGGRVGLIDTAVKSVTWETPIVFIENGEPKYSEIGRWIDQQLENNKEHISNEEYLNMELLDIHHPVYIPTMDYNGNTNWGKISAVSRHDPSEVLYKITTESGRNVTVTDTKSLLIWMNELNEFKEVKMSEINEGDYVPTTYSITSPIKDMMIKYNIEEKDYIGIFELNIALKMLNQEKDIVEKYLNSITNKIFNDRKNVQLLDVIGYLYNRLNKMIVYKKNEIIVVELNETYTNKYKSIENVILDKIISIEKISNEQHPKMYDLTIPSTFNFGLANGLQVRDTSETGYIQRRLIKGMEDLKVEYDMTVRNNMGKIVQFEYGDDSMETTKVESQTLPLVDMTVEDIYSHYTIPDDVSIENDLNTMTFTQDALKRMTSQKIDLKQKTMNYIENMIDTRKELVENVFKMEHNKNVNCPVHFQRIINNVKHQMNIKSNSLVDVTPLECFNIIEECKETIQKIHSVKVNKLFEALFNYYMVPRELLYIHRYNRASLNYLTQVIITNYKKSIIAPGEMVGMIAAQSIGEPTTQLTLNSVTYETEIPVRDSRGYMYNVQIGDFVNKYINECIGKKEYYASKDTTYAELDKESQYYEILAPSEDGEMLWCRIEAVTKHPVVNEDGTNTMLKITTENEREVIVTKAKSLLKVIDGKLLESPGSDAKIGDYVPINTMKYQHTPVYELDLKTVLSPKEYLFMSEVEKAIRYKDEGHWWKKHNNVDFVLPYSRSDAFLDMVERNILHTKKKNGTNNSVHYEYGNVYMKHNSRTASQLPELMQLDYDFGYLLGAYCAEGCVTKTQISIANINNDYLEPIKRFCEKFNITYKVYKTENKIQEGWTSQDIRIYSKLLTELLVKLCNKISHTKTLSNTIVYSNDECKKGFLDAYIGGDGYISKKEKCIIMFSTSKELLEKVQCMLNTFEIYSFIRKIKKQTSNNRGTTDFQQAYRLYVSNNQCKKLSSLLDIKIDYKKEECMKKSCQEMKLNINKFNDAYIPSFNSEKQEYEMLKRSDVNDAYKNIVFEKIKSIEEVSNTTDYAYDLTVETTRNFVTVNGLNLRDTFHSAGISSKSNVTRGVPRIQEILSLSKEAKNPSLSIYLKPEDQHNKLKAQQLMYVLEHTQLRDVVESVSICYDPDNLNTLIDEDKELISQYKMFESMTEECAQISPLDTQRSKWIIRFVLDKEAMLDKNITMDDVHFALNAGYKDEIECIFSDFNSDKLVFRVRLMDLLKKKSIAGASKGLDQSDDVYMLKNVQESMLDNIILKGAKNITKVILRKLQDNVVKEGLDYVKQEAWVLDTIGTNLLDMLSFDEIDNTRTFSNDIIEVHNVLGIEATRQCIYNEIADVLEFDGTYINYHHMALLCDRMCYSKNLISIFRHGINNDNIGPIAKATFEETPEMFLRAARHAEFDNMRGVSANIMCGQEGNFGTSSFQVVVDLMKMTALGNKTLQQVQNIDDMFDGIENKDDPCAISNIQTISNVNVIKSVNVGDDNDYEPDF